MDNRMMRPATRAAKSWKNREKASMEIMPPSTVPSGIPPHPIRYIETPRDITAPLKAKYGSHFFSLDPIRSNPKTSTTLRKRTSWGRRNMKICTVIASLYFAFRSC
jgi:hypothetical protein